MERPKLNAEVKPRKSVPPQEQRPKRRSRSPNGYNGKLTKGQSPAPPIREQEVAEFDPDQLPDAPESFWRRHTLADSARRAAFLEKIMQGNYLSVAARYIGVQPDTIHKALTDGRNGVNKELYQFYKDYLSAEAESESYLVGQMAKHSGRDWRAAEALLKRRFPERWGDKQPADAGGGNGNQDNRRLAVIQLTDSEQSRGLVRDLVNQLGSNSDKQPVELPEDDRQVIDQ